MTDEKNSSSSPSSGKKKPRRRRRKKPNPNKPKGDNPQAKSAAPKKQASGGSKSKPNPNSKNKKRKPNSKKPLRDHEIILKYDNLMEQHLLARKRYFENYHRKDKKRVEKLERNFQKTGLDVRAFENRLKPHQFEILEKKINGYALDLDYSTRTGEEPITELPTGPFADPHENEVQASRPEFKDDTELTMGTMEDYEKYREERSA